MPTTPTSLQPDWVTPLLELLGSQRGIIQRLRPIAERQGELIESGRTDALLGLLAERQRLLDGLLEAQETIAGISEARRDAIPDLPEARRRELRDLMEEIEGGLAVVLEIDARDQQRLREARDDAKRRLTAHDTARTARGAYVKPGPEGPRFTDRRG